MVETDPCPTCGTPRPADSPAGICPLCLMRLGLDEEDPPSLDSMEDAVSLGADRAEPNGVVGERLRTDVTAIEIGDIAAYAGDKWSLQGAKLAEPGRRLFILGEIARGGMGIVLLGHDTELGRDIAIKVLHDKHRDHPNMIDRFVAEARIAGQLQHPGVVPVHELGILADRRPFFTMKLVRGSTLAEILADRSAQAADRAQLLRIFLRVADAIGYAHERSVIHRDLKPSNIMVGRHGEVMVMDWGLAKVSTRRDDADADAAGSRRSSSRVLPDSGVRMRERLVMGTPAYMAPEQFEAEEGSVDERADVFALGAVLSEILTGRPVYEGSSPDEIRHQAARGELAPALLALETCGADTDLIDLVRDCLATDRNGRPRCAGIVAARLSSYLGEVETRLRAAELARIEAQARAVEERKRGRLTAILAVLCILLAVLGASTYAGWLQRRHARETGAALVLREVEMLRDAAEVDPSCDPARWVTAGDTLRRASLLLADAPESIHERLAATRGQIEYGLARAQRIRGLLDRLEIACDRADDHDLARADTLFEESFQEAELRLEDAAPADVAGTIASWPAEVTLQVIAALDCWAIVLRDLEGDGIRPAGAWQVPLRVARAADPDPWRIALRNSLAAKDSDALARLADSDDLESRPPPSLWLLGRLLVWDDQTERAVDAMARARRAHPDDYWINLDLSLFLSLRPYRPQRAITFVTTAVALRPNSATARLRRGELLEILGEHAEAETELREAVRIAPNHGYAHFTLGHLHAARGRWEQAIPEYQAAIQLMPRHAAKIRIALAEALPHVVHPEHPNDALEWYAAGLLQIRQGDGAGAVRALGEAAARAKSGSPEAADMQGALEQAEEIVRLQSVLNGEASARDNLERRQFIRLCHRYGWGAGAVRLYVEALAADPHLPHVQGESHVMDAARAAAIAGTGRSRDVPSPGPAERARLRGLALVWLRTDLDDWYRRFAPDRRETRRRAAKYYRRWIENKDVAGVCDPKELAALPADECKAWRDFWREVEIRILVDPGYPGRGAPVQATSSLYEQQLGLFPD